MKGKIQFLVILYSLGWHFLLSGQVNTPLLIIPDRVFDGQNLHDSWAVLIEKDKISAAGPIASIKIPANVRRLELPGTTLLPGLIEGHSHLLLHPYNETSWNDQVLVESEAERVVRATVHARKTLEAGFTTVRDLGSEGAGYADVGLKQSIEKGIIPGPRMLVAGPAIVATGSYGPKGFAPHVDIPLGAEEADGHDNLIKVVREQMGKGADVVKVYADYRWGVRGEARATFSLEELQLMVKTAASSGRGVVAHAGTEEGMRRAALAGVVSIEHGDAGTPEVFKLMAEKGVALCPTLAAGDAILQYRGWRKGVDAEPERIVQKRKSFKQALDAGVTILAGGDVGVFTHGDNARELEMMVDYGMKPLEVLKSATSINAKVFGLSAELGAIRPGLLADLLIVEGRPDQNISDLRKIQLVIKGGVIVVEK
ncbi:MAG: amidohydrolase family protein [Haliscomenobacter sp.]|uniref:metal-dependent hydrolase family protein n=1 Tax=Haliscomenobacter sp. TaxID=2717303 RepID=UPI0029B39013|nr:amidohydrolase family protein [Haliscomenobacter sp.]MDX2068003.1 amidohydrolase family protein [Haliscomenobacter sp.]